MSPFSKSIILPLWLVASLVMISLASLTLAVLLVVRPGALPMAISATTTPVLTLTPSATASPSRVPTRRPTATPEPHTPTPRPTVGASPTPTTLPSVPWRLAFTSDRDGNLGLFVMDLNIALQGSDGTGLTRLAYAMPMLSAAWSPDGQQVAFASVLEGYTHGLYLMNIDGGNLRLLVEGDYSSVGWSPDSQKLVFVCDANQLCALNRDGSNLNRLTEPPNNGHSPAWSPDGDSIAYATNRSDGRAEIYLMDPQGRNAHAIAVSSSAAVTLAWAPSGDWIAFGTTSASNGVYLMKPDGSELRQIASDGSFPSWSPDGLWLAFYAIPTNSPYRGIFLLNVKVAVEGRGQPIPLTRNIHFNSYPVWLPANTPRLRTGWCLPHPARLNLPLPEPSRQRR